MRTRVVVYIAAVAIAGAFTLGRGSAPDPADDPGTLAYAAGLERHAAGDFASAADEFARAAADDAAPVDRVARALYNRGTALLASDAVEPLTEAVAALERCRDLAPADPVLRGDCRFNLELAEERLRAAAQRPPPDPGGEGAPPKSGDSVTSGGTATKQGVRPAGAAKAGPPANGAESGGPPQPGAGGMPVVAGSGPSRPLSADESRRVLSDVARRLAESRRAGGTAAGPEWEHVPNW